MNTLNLAVLVTGSLAIAQLLCLLIITLKSKEGEDPISLFRRTYFISKPMSKNNTTNIIDNEKDKEAKEGKQGVMIQILKEFIQKDSTSYRCANYNSKRALAFICHFLVLPFFAFPLFC
jgi:hypothetical protein